MHTLPVLETRPPSALEPSSPAEELTLLELLELFAAEDAAEPASVRRTLRSSIGRLRSSAARLGMVVQGWSRRAAQWGAVPGRPGPRSSRSSQFTGGRAQ